MHTDFMDKNNIKKPGVCRPKSSTHLVKKLLEKVSVEKYVFIYKTMHVLNMYVHWILSDKENCIRLPAYSRVNLQNALKTSQDVHITSFWDTYMCTVHFVIHFPFLYTRHVIVRHVSTTDVHHKFNRLLLSYVLLLKVHSHMIRLAMMVVYCCKKYTV